MNYIILDMEWNQPVSREKTVTPTSGKTALFGEIIRIGAVRLDEELNDTGKFHISIRPLFYKKMNSTVQRVTGLGSNALKSGVAFPSAYRSFRNWCGSECVFLTWGSEDERVLMSNLAAHRMIFEEVPKFYNLQLIYAYKIARDGKLRSLKYALDFYGLSSELKAHDALNDAIYAARVAEKMDFTEHLSGYDNMIAEVLQRKSEKYHRTYLNILSPEEAVSNTRIMARNCPKCRRLMKHNEWIPQREGVYISIGECREHGEYFFRIRMKLCADGKYAVTKTIRCLSEEYREFYQRIYTGLKN
ncbi:MAG: exonuclease domain-containing protein [Huintestinicola sp.]